MIGTRLAAYLPQKKIAREDRVAPRWTQFSSNVTNFYALLRIHNDEARRRLRGELLEAVGSSAQGEEDDEWQTLKIALLEEKSAIIQVVMEARKIRIWTSR